MGYCAPRSSNMLVTCSSAPQPNDTPPPSVNCKLSDITFDAPNDKMEEDSCKLTPPNSNVSSENASESNATCSNIRSEHISLAPGQNDSTSSSKQISVPLIGGSDMSGDLLRLPDSVFSSLNTLLPSDMELLNQVNFFSGSCSSVPDTAEVKNDTSVQAQPQNTQVIASINNSKPNTLEQNLSVTRNASMQPVLAKDETSTRLSSVAVKQLRLQKRQNQLLRRMRRIGVRASYADILNQKSTLSEHAKKLNNYLKTVEGVDDSSASKILEYIRARETFESPRHHPSLAKAVLGPPHDICEEVEEIAGEVDAVSHMYTAYDSEATESSSAVESCDEGDGYDDTMRARFKPIQRRALPRAQRERAWTGSRWSFLESRVHSLDCHTARISKRLRMLEQVQQSEQ